MNKNNYLVKYENSNLEKRNIKSHSKLLLYVHTLTDAIYMYTLINELLEYINDLLNNKISSTEFKKEIICMIEEVNIRIGIELTNFPITFSHYSIIKDVEINQPNFNGFSALIQKLFDLCNNNRILDQTFKKEVKVLLREILQYN